MSDDEIRLGGATAESGGGGTGRIQVRADVLVEIDEHVGSDTTVEQGGVLLGTVDAATGTTVISARIPAVGAISEVASLRFTHETWDHVNDVMEREHPDEKMVGWYHSHPHFGIFLSEYDQFIHNNFFSQPWQVAYVVDPLLRQRGFFAWVDGRLERVATWETWQTERGEGDAPVGTPPPPPSATAPPAPGGPAGAAPGFVAPPGPAGAAGVPAPDDHRRVNPWSLGLLVFLLVALVAGVLAVVGNPFSSGDDDFRITHPGDLDDAEPASVTPGGLTPDLGPIEIVVPDPDIDPQDLSWTYQATDGSDAPPNTVIVTPRGRRVEDGFDAAWTSLDPADDAPHTGTLFVSYCSNPCEPDDAHTATTPVKVHAERTEGDRLLPPAPERFVTGPGIVPFVPGEHLLAAPGTDEPLLPTSGDVAIVGRLGVGDPDNATTVWQVDVGGDVPASDLASSGLLPEVGVVQGEARPRADLSAVQLDAVGASPSEEKSEPASVEIIDAAGFLERTASLACGDRGLSLNCDASGGPTPEEAPEPLGLVSLPQLLTKIADAQPGLGALLLPAMDCTDTPARVAEAFDLLTQAMDAKDEVLWVVPATAGCLAARSTDNIITVGALGDEVNAEVDVQVDVAPMDGSAYDAAALAVGAASEAQAAAGGAADPASVRSCIIDSTDDDRLDVDAAVAACSDDRSGDDQPEDGQETTTTTVDPGPAPTDPDATTTTTSTASVPATGDTRSRNGR